MASVIAMLYLTLFSTLAVGYYAATSVSNEVAHNDQEISKAMFAAESGLDFMRYQLSTVVIPGSAKQSDLLQHVYDGLSAQMDGTGNLGTATIGFSGGAIQVPAGNGTIKLADGSQFSATVTSVGADVRVQVAGRFNSTQVSRHVQLDFRLAQNNSPIFDYGLATRGRITMTGASFVKGATDAKRGSILSTWDATATAINISTAIISGEVSLTNSGGAVTGSGTIGGTNVPAKWPIHKGIGQPEFPSVDTSAFAQYLVGKETVITGSTDAAYLKNIRIKKNANPNFSGGPTIEGVIYIEAPNKVLFSGGAHITGVIVVDNPDEATSTNSITIEKGGTLNGPENLSESFGELRNLTGAAILAPNFGLVMTGGSATVGGTTIVKSLLLSGGSGGTFNGSLILTGNSTLSMSGGSGITISGPPAGSIAGVKFSGSYQPLMETYLEPTK
jgi:hypothetical protein